MQSLAAELSQSATLIRELYHSIYIYIYIPTVELCQGILK